MKFLLLLLLSIVTNIYSMKKELYKAIDNNDMSRVENLLKEYGPIYKKTSMGDELLYAVRKGNVTLVQKFFENGVDLNQRSENGDTAVIVATKHKKIDLVKFLISLGAQADQYDGGLNDAYTWAKVYNSVELMELLEPLRMPMDPSWTLCKK